MNSSFTSYMDHLTLQHGTPTVFKYVCTACTPSTVFQDIHRFKCHITGQHLHLFDTSSQASNQQSQGNVHPERNPSSMETASISDLFNLNEPETMQCKENVEKMILTENNVLELKAMIRESAYKFTLNLYSKPSLTRKDVVQIQNNVTEEIIKPIYKIFTSLSAISENENIKDLLNDLREPFNFISTEQKFNSASQSLGLRDSLQILNFKNNNC